MHRVFVMLGHLQFNRLWVLCTLYAFSSIQFTRERKYMHGCRYALNGTAATLDGSQCLALMYGQTLGWSYVITVGMQRLGKLRWQKDLECRHVQERILIPCCICSWHARDLPTRPETNQPVISSRLHLINYVHPWGDYVREPICCHDLSVSYRVSFDSFVTSPMCGDVHQPDYFVFLGLQVLHHDLQYIFLKVTMGMWCRCC